MAGSILGKDQIAKVNSLYAKIHSHIANLIGGAPSPIELMRVHVLTEHLDTTELSTIFMELPFLSPAEKRALVRTAIFDVLVNGTVGLPLDIPAISPLSEKRVVTEVAHTFTPPAFKLNVATVEAHQQAQTIVEAPAVPQTPTVLTKLSDLRKDAREKHDVAEAERQEAVKQIREDHQGE